MIEKLPNECIGLLREGIAELGIEIEESKQAALLQYLALLVKWNKAFNLTAIRQPEQMVIKHLLDSLSVSAHLSGNNIIDVGTGAGIPGIPLAIVNPEKHLTLMDANGKKIRFLQQVKQSLGLEVMPIQQRVESYNVKQRYDSVISRAFTSLEQIVQLSGHLVSDNGLIQAMKGAYPEPDQKQLPLGWQIEKVIKLTVPGLEEQRHLVNIRKCTERG